MRISRSVRAMRTAISPRLATSTFLNMRAAGRIRRFRLLAFGLLPLLVLEADLRRRLEGVVDPVGLVGKSFVARGVEGAGRDGEGEIFVEDVGFELAPAR